MPYFGCLIADARHRQDLALHGLSAKVNAVALNLTHLELRHEIERSAAD